MHLGMIVPQNELGTDARAIRRWASAVETSGFDFIDIFDHVLGADVTDRPDWPGPYTVEHRFHEPFTLLAHLAAVVDLDLATGVLVLPQRQTALVAKQAAELDLLTGGRFRLGVGIGWNPVEYEALGMTFADRARRFETQIALLRRLWSDPVLDHADAFHRVDRAGIAPRPSRPVPIWLGGGTAPAVLDRIGRVADGWVIHQSSPDDQLDAALATVASTAGAAGRDPAEIALQGRIDIHGSLDVERLHRSIAAWVAVGVTHLALHATGQGPIDAHSELIARLVDVCHEHVDVRQGPT